MYNETIDTNNKIITADDLLEIFSMMNEKLQYYKNIYKKEAMENEKLEYAYQRWTFKDSDSSIKFRVSFYDNTDVSFDNYSSFLVAFNSRLRDIKYIYCSFYLRYGRTGDDGKVDYCSQHIVLDISEKKINADFSFISNDNKINDVYEFIKNKINSAPIRYDNIVKKRSSIEFTVGFAISFIISFVLVTLSLLVPAIRDVFFQSYVLYPISCLLLSILFSGVISSTIFSKYYQNIVPEKKYAGYDKQANRSIYKDDIEKYTGNAEILIGRNYDNLNCRKMIEEMYNKYKKFIPIELIVLAVCSFIVFLIVKMAG